MMSSCGVICGDCEFFKQTCEGCAAVQGKPFWIKEFGIGQCGLFNCCVNEKTLAHCGDCSSLPCSMFFEYKDPSWSDEQHMELLKVRIERLRAGNDK